ncbi:MAG: hypothetical protein ACN6ON_18985, partial [Sphingobacterium sp.]
AMKIINSLFVFIFCMTASVFSQENVGTRSLTEFEKSFSTAIQYPEQLLERCIPTFTVMKLKFNRKGELEALDFSDSAFPQFVQEVLSKKEKIGFHYLYQEALKLGKQDDWIVVPIQINTKIAGRCESTIMPYDLEHSLLFAGKPLTGKYYLYHKFIATVGIGVMYN